MVSQAVSTEFGEGTWELEDWLYRFDPEDEARNWVWWDLTGPSDHTARLWVDTGGEDIYASMDLRWLAYVCGAVKVSEPDFPDASVWARQRSIGLG